MAEPTDRDRERAVAWLKASCTVASVFVIMDLANQFAAAREEGRLEAIEECAKIADGGAALLDGIEIRFVTPEKLATDLAKDIADGIRSLGEKEPT